MGIVGRYAYEIAELYYGSLKAEGLTVDMVQVDDEWTMTSELELRERETENL